VEDGEASYTLGGEGGKPGLFLNKIESEMIWEKKALGCCSFDAFFEALQIIARARESAKERERERERERARARERKYRNLYRNFVYY
jgi:hypothetical protein